MQGLLSLDISFNDVEDAAELARQLAALAALRNLRVAGNPLCLQHGYKHILCELLPTLCRLDSEDTASITDDRKGTPQSVTVDGPAEPYAPGSGGATSHCNICLDIGALVVHDPAGASDEPRAAAAGQPEPPMRPAVYYIDTSTFNGAPVTTTAICFGAPAAPPAQAKGAPDKAKGKGKAPAAVEEAPAVPAGQLTMQLRLPCTVAARDWLDTGMELKLWQVEYSAVAQELSDEQKAVRAAPKGKGKAGVCCGSPSVSNRSTTASDVCDGQRRPARHVLCRAKCLRDDHATIA